MSQSSPKPYRIEFSDEMLRDLGERLSRTRWPEVPPQTPWTTGTSIAYMRDLVDYWRDRFDLGAQEKLLNRVQKFKAPGRGNDLPFFPEQSQGPKPMPLPPSHWWAGSLVEVPQVNPNT